MVYTFLDSDTQIQKSAYAATEKDAARIVARCSFGRSAEVIATGTGWRIDTPRSSNIGGLVGATRSAEILAQYTW